MLTPTGQILQLIIWFLALTEFTLGFYVFTLNVHTALNRYLSALFIGSAINTLLVGFIADPLIVDNTPSVFYLLYAATHCTPTIVLLLSTIILKPQWLEKLTLVKWSIYGLGVLPTLLTLADHNLGLNLWRLGLAPDIYSDGLPVQLGYSGTLSQIIQASCYLQIFATLGLLTYSSVYDTNLSTKKRRYARLILLSVIGMAILNICLNTQIGFIITNAVSYLVPTLACGYIGFKEIKRIKYLGKASSQVHFSALILIIIIPLQIASLISANVYAQKVTEATLDATTTASLNRFRQLSWLFTTTSLIMFLSMLWFVFQHTLAPIKKMAHIVKSLAEGNLSLITDMENEFEIGISGPALNSMATRLRQLIMNLEHEVSLRTFDLEQKNRQLTSLQSTIAAINSTLNLDQVLAIALKEGVSLLEVSSASVWLIDENNHELVCRQSSAFERDILRGCRLSQGQGLAGWVAENGTAAIVADAQLDKRYFKEINENISPSLHSVLSVPLKVKEKVIGVLQVVHIAVNKFDAADLALLQPLALSMANAIENSRLYEQAQRELRDRKQAESALKQSERDYRELFENAYDAIIVFDPQKEAILKVNQIACEFYGFSHQEFIGMQLQNISPNSKLGAELSRLDDDENAPQHFECTHRRKDSSELLVEVTTSMVNYKGNPAILSINRDITARVLAEKQRASLLQKTQLALKETQALYQTSRTLITFQNHNTMLKTTADTVAEALSADRILLITLDLEEKKILTSIDSGPGRAHIQPLTFEELEGNLVGWVIREKQAALSPKNINDPRESLSMQKRRRDASCGAIIVAPLQCQGKILGTIIAINRPDQQDFTPQDLDFMVTIANQTAAAIQNTQLFEQTQSALAEMRALYNFSRHLSSLTNHPRLLQTAVNMIADILDTTRVVLAIFNLERRRIDRVFVGGDLEAAAELSFDDLWEDLNGWVIREQRPALSLKASPDPRESTNAQEKRIQAGWGSIIVAPLLYHEQIRGTITAYNRQAQRDFTQHDVDLIAMIANQIATSVENKRLFKQTQIALSETQALYHLSRELNTLQDLPQLLQTTANAVARSLPATRIMLLLMETESGQVTGNFVGGDTQSKLNIDCNELWGDLSGWVLRELQPAIIFKNTTDPRENPETKRRRLALGLDSLMLTPLHHRDKILGTMIAINFQDDDDFTTRSLDLMMVMSNQISAAINNVLLFQQTQRALIKTQALYRASRPLFNFKNPEALLQAIVDAVIEALPAWSVTLIMFDTETRTVANIVTSGHPGTQVSFISYETLWQGLTGWVLREQKPALSQKGGPDLRESASVRQSRENNDVGAVIVAPLRYREKTLGTITAMNRIDQRDFDQRDVELLMAIANQAAAAVENACLFEQAQLEIKERKRAEAALRNTLVKTEALYNIAKALSVHERLEDLLQTVADSVAEALPADKVSLITLSPEEHEITHYITSGPGAPELKPLAYEELMEGLFGWVLREKKSALSLKDYPDHRENHQAQKMRVRNKNGSAIVIPLQYRGVTLAVLTAINRLDQANFTEQDVTLTMTIANQATATIENANLFEEIQTSLAETQTLYNISRALIAFDSLPKLLQSIADRVAQVISANHSLLVIVDMERECIIDTVSGGQWDPQVHVVASFEELMESLSGWVIREGKPALSLKSKPDFRESSKIQQQRQINQRGSTLVVPLRYRDQILGTLTATNPPERADFGQREVNLMLAIASQAAIAIENARLFEQMQANLKETSALYKVSRALINYENIAKLLKVIADKVAAALPATWSMLSIIDMQSRQIKKTVLGGENAKFNPITDFEAFTQGLAGQAIRTLNPVLIPQNQNTPHKANLVNWEQANDNCGAILIVPLHYRGNILGTLTAINAAEQHNFTNSDAELMMTMANQAAIAIENARLVENLEAEVVARTAKIREEQENNETILNNVGEAILMTDQTLSIRYINPAFTRLTQYQPSEILGQSVRMLNEEEAYLKAWHAVTTPNSDNKLWHGDVTIKRKDHRPYDAAMTITPMFNYAGERSGYVASHHDISLLKNMERARSGFMHNVSHQLRTPITTIKLYLHLMQTAANVEKSMCYLKMAEQETDNLLHLIENILEMANLDSEKIKTTHDSINLASLAELLLTRYKSAAEKAKLSLTLAPPPANLPTTHGSETRLMQALEKIVENAITFTPAGGKISLELASAVIAEQPWLTFAVHDTGPGIARKEQTRIFERFYRGSLADSGHTIGTGLGLSIARAIIQAHGGKLTVESEVGRGSIFKLWLRSKV